jgi:hypothetical protein
MPEIVHIEVQVRPPSRRYQHGRTTKAAYMVEDDLVTLLNPLDGEPARDPDGKLYQHKVGPGTAGADGTARYLTKELWDAWRGNLPAGFSEGGGGGWRSGKLGYPKGGWR